MDSLSEVFEALFMEGPYRFVLQCVCKIERLFSVNVIRTSCLEVATSARVWMGAIVLVLACELAPAAYASEGALRVQAVNPRSRRLPTPRHCPKQCIPKMAGNTTRLLANGSTTKTRLRSKGGCMQGAFGIGSITRASWLSALRNAQVGATF